MFCSKAPRSLRNKENCLLSSVGCWGKISHLNNNECKRYGFEEGEYLCVRHFDEERKQKQQPGCCFPKRSLEDTCSGVQTNCPQRLVAVFKEPDTVKTGYGKICLGHLQLACERRRISGCRLSPVYGGDKRQPEIRLRSQAICKRRIATRG